jgi:hypothetical protein
MTQAYVPVGVRGENASSLGPAGSMAISLPSLCRELLHLVLS